MPLLSRSSRSFGKNTDSQITDVNAKYTTALITGDTPASAWVDDASGAKTRVTINGSASPIKATPYIPSGYASASFNFASSQTEYFTIAQNAIFTIGTNDFTIECWIWLNGTAGDYTIYDCRTAGSSVSPNWYFQGSNNLSWMVSGSNQIAAGYALPAYTWHHVAICRASGSTRLFINGKQAGATYTDGNTYTSGINTIGHNAAAGGGDNSFPGLIYDFRIVNGTALYRTNFYPPTKPLDVITNTVLLTCRDATRTPIDRSPYNNTITKNTGQQTVNTGGYSHECPFIPSDVSYNGYYNGSIFNNGTGNNVTIPSPAWSTFATIFTLEFWIYFPSALPSNKAVLGYNASGGLTIYSSASTQWSINRFGTGDVVTTTTNLVGGQWTHIAVTKDAANLMTIWINGTSGGTATVASAFTAGDWVLNNDAQQYVADFRVVYGTALYSSAFTPPTSSLTVNNSNTQILIGQTYQPSNNHTFLDGSYNRAPVVRTGNPSQGSTNPFGDNWSYYFSGADLITYPHLDQYNIYGSDATIDFWINIQQSDALSRGIINHATTAGSWQGWQVYVLNGKIVLETNDAASVTSGLRYTATRELPIGQWTFIRITKTNYERWSIYYNGVNAGSAQDINATHNATTPMIIGQSRNAGPNFIGFISNLRIIKGQIVNTELPFNNATVTYFNGSSYVANTNSTALAFGTTPYTVELWMNNRSGSNGEFDVLEGNPATGNWQFFYQTGNGGLKWGQYGGTAYTITTAASAATIFGNTWGHVAISRVASGLTNAYINGSLVVSSSDTFNYVSTGLSMGGRNTGTQYFTGAITNVRVVKGTALYTSDFEPQRTPLAVTQLGKDTRQYPDKSYSVRFNGAGDYLSINATSNTIAGDFTWETWVYDNGTQSNSTLLGWRSGSSSWSGFIIQRNTSANNLNVTIINAALTNLNIVQTSGTYLLNSWLHCAVTRSGSTVTVWVNGINVGTGTLSGTISPSASYWIGSDPYNNVSAVQLGGYISNQRFINGTALYTSNFVPPTAALLNVSGTSVLTCQSSTFIDNSTNNFTVTASGTPSITNKFPYVFGDVIPALSSGTSLLALQTADFVDNGGANIRLDVGGSPKTSQIFTPTTIPTTAFTTYEPGVNGSNIVLITAGSNKVQDTSIYNNKLTSVTGNPIVTRFSPVDFPTMIPKTYSYKINQWNTTIYHSSNNYASFRRGPLTIEWWMYQTGNVNADAYIWGGGTNQLSCKIEPAGRLTLVRPGFTNFITVPAATAGANLWTNNWCHVAIVKSDEYQWNIFINGSNVYAAAYSYDAWGGDWLNIGGVGQQTDFGGYISNFRISRSALYQSNFTPSLEPLQLTGDTLSLTAQSSTLTAQSDYPPLLPAKVYGSSATKPVPFNPLGYTAIPGGKYNANLYGGSTYFDGNGDYLTVNEFQKHRLSNAFTIQGWFNATSQVAGNIVIASKGAVATGWEIGIGRANTLLFTNATVALATVTPIRFNEWNHFAITRDDVSWYTRVFLNGNLEVTGTITNPFNETANIKIGSGRVAGANVFTGYIAGLQIDTAVAAYANNFIPPYLSQRPTANTVFYLDNYPGVIDYSGKSNFETVGGNMVRSLAVNSSNLALFTNSEFFNQPNGDRLSVADNAALQFGTGDFTVECWIYPISVGGAQRGIVGKGTNTTGWELRIGGAASGGLDFSYTATGVTSSTVVTQNTWHHVALTRSGTSIKSFLDGVNVGSATSGADFIQTDILKIGCERTTQTFDGYISNLRLVKGTALYTADFTRPSIPVSVVSGTSLLTCQSGTLIDNSGNGFTPTIGAGSPTVSSFSPFPTYTWLGNILYPQTVFFDGSSYLRTGTTANLGYFISGNTAPVTFEANIYPVADNTTLNLFALGGETYNRFVMYIVNGYATINSFGGAAANLGFPKIQTNTWTHIAFTRSANIVYGYLNGIQIVASSNINGNTLGAGAVWIGADTSGTSPFKGYMKDIRFTNGLARYTANTTIPSKLIAPKTYQGFSTALAAKPNVSYIIVAGGGSGGTNAGSGGGGGGFQQGTFTFTKGVVYPIVIGGGGAPAGSPVGDTVNGTNGSNSTIFGYTIYGGGAGGTGTAVGWPGGSGGGTPSQGLPLIGGTGYFTRDVFVPGQGYAGGFGPSGSSVSRTTGGGGGANKAGSSLQVGIGGQGAPTWITGANILLAGGGGGGHHTTPGAGSGGGGGGGDGGLAGVAGNVGLLNTGGGGGGGSGNGFAGAAGGSGIIILKHPSAMPVATATGNVLVTTTSTNVLYQFYSSGTIQFL